MDQKKKGKFYVMYLNRFPSERVKKRHVLNTFTFLLVKIVKKKSY